MAARFLQNSFPDPAPRTLDLAKLTDRERQVFQLQGASRSTLEIAVELQISPMTVGTYRGNLKLSLRGTPRGGAPAGGGS